MAISDRPSKLSLPQSNPGVETILEYLILKFPYVDEGTWRQRFLDGKVHRHDGTLISAGSPFEPQLRVYYYREIESEARIPFEESILYQDEQLLVAYKPHFLPVVPGGKFVKECLQSRLREKTGLESLQALHRLDRVTAGIVLFSCNPATRGDYHYLFETRQIEKTYHAVAKIQQGQQLTGKHWVVKNRIETGEPKFRMQIVDGEANSHSLIRCLSQNSEKALFELKPITGKTHQLRVHMQSLGWPILNDKYYPTLQPLSEDNFDKPLQLLAKEIRFTDPVTQETRHFSCEQSLPDF